MSVLAAAQLCRADAGLEEYPRIPFGTRVMVVRDPKSKDAFAPIALPATVFGPCSMVTSGMWTYQKGNAKCRTNIAVQGMTAEDINWVKVNVDNWDPPDAPLPLPPADMYDARCLTPSRPADGGATRDTVTCQACLAVKRKQKVTTRHNLRWGEYLRATPPPPTAVSDEIRFDEDEDKADEIEVTGEMDQTLRKSERMMRKSRRCCLIL